MKTTELRDQLVQNLQPVKRLRSIRQRFSIWASLTLVILIAVIFVTGIRISFGYANHPFYIIESGIIVAFTILAAIQALLASVPGQDKWPRWMISSLFGSWFALCFTRLGAHLVIYGWRAFVPDLHVGCAIITLLISAIASIPLFVLLIRAAPLEPMWCGVLTGIASGGAAMISVQLYCVYHAPAHVVAWHVFPVLMIVVILAPLMTLFGKNKS